MNGESLNGKFYEIFPSTFADFIMCYRSDKFWRERGQMQDCIDIFWEWPKLQNTGKT